MTFLAKAARSTSGIRILALLTLISSLCLLTRPAALSAPAESTGLSIDLNIVPRDAAAFVHIRTGDLWNSETFADVRNLIAKAGPQAVQAFQKKYALFASAIERMTLVMVTPQTLAAPFPDVDPEGVSALIVVTTRQPFDREKLVKLWATEKEAKSYRDRSYFFNEDVWGALLVLDARTFVLGSEDAIVQLLDLPERKRAEGPMTAALEAAAQKHHITVGLNHPLLAQERGIAQLIPPPLQPLLNARYSTLSCDFSKELQLEFHFEYAGAAEAKKGEEALRSGLELARMGLAMPMQELEAKLVKQPQAGLTDLPEQFGTLVGLGALKEIDARLQNAPVQQKGTSVRLPVSVPRPEAVNVFLLSLGAISFMGQSAHATFQTVAAQIGGGGDPLETHLKQIADGLEKYHADKGSYPPAAIYDKDGKPLLSWRVALLPYVGEQALYKQFKLDEPWHSLNNKKLIKKMPKAFQSPRGWRSWQTPDKWKTPDRLFVGAGTAFEGREGVKKNDVDPKTILLAHIPEYGSVYWSKPAELDYADDKDLPNLFGKYGSQFQVLLADGSFREVSKNMNQKALRDMIKRKPVK